MGSVTDLLERWWHSRIGRRLLREILVMYCLFMAYRFGRMLTADALGAAYANARKVIDLERTLGVFTELDVQNLVLNHGWLVQALNRYYVSAHFASAGLCLAWLYLRHPNGYLRMRRLFVAITALGLIGHIVFPLAPPRMMHGQGFVDTLAAYGPAVYDSDTVSSLANEVAAMPSLHFGWAVLVAIGVIGFATSPLRWLAIAHPVITLVAIVATANHYWIDAAAAGAMIAAVLRVESWWVSRRRAGGEPIEEPRIRSAAPVAG